MRVEFDLSDHPEFAEIWEKASPYTMTSPERGFALYQAVNAVIDNNISGNFVECGVWKGGSAMIMALTLLKRSALREIYLFDTYAGMTAAGENDLDLNGEDADALMAGSHGDDVAELVKAEAPLDSVQEALATIDYPQQLIYFIKGDVRETLAKTRTSHIALLRLDTDFYDSTLASLKALWPRLVSNGLYIIDDYGHWQGAKKAFHAFFDDDANPFQTPLLWRLDYTGYGGVKLQNIEDPEIERYDYVPAGFEVPDLLPLFPYAEEKDPKTVNWEYLRYETPHIWRSDTRDDKPWNTGNVSVEEAACLYTLAKQFGGKRALEIGSHFGWTAAHILSAGVHLDCIDPEFSAFGRSEAVAAVLDQVDTNGDYRLWGGFSPDLVDEVRATKREPFSFVLIDGSHDADAPRLDAQAVLPHLANNCVVVFHDLTSPFVERGLYVFRQEGFQTRLFNTMQILGVAWRGNVSIPDHQADRNVPIFLPKHLHKYEI